MGGAQAPAGNAQRLPVSHPVRVAATLCEGAPFYQPEATPEFMNKATPLDQPTVQAIHVTTEAQRRAFRVVDAIDDLHSQLGAYRSIEQLMARERRGSDESVAPLWRRDLVALLSVLNTNFEAHCVKALEAAVLSAKGD